MFGLTKALILASFMGLMSSCAHSPSVGPLGDIKNEDARKLYLQTQQSAGSLTYKDLYYKIKMLHELYPEEDIIAITHAGVHGDLGQTLTEEKEIQFKNAAVEMLKPYINKTYPSMLSQTRIMAFNQYYFHSKQYLKQYDYGNLIISEGGQGGEILKAVGASMYALELDQKNHRQQSQYYAIEARKVWEQMYDLTDAGSRVAAFQNQYYISSIALSGGCTLATTLFKQMIVPTRRHSEMTRWYSTFNPQHLKSCSIQRQLSGQ